MKVKTKVYLSLVIFLVLHFATATYGYRMMKGALRGEFQEKAAMMEAFGSSVRRYLVQNQRPIALQYIPSFYPELMSSSYTVRKVMELSNDRLHGLHFRQPALEPRNSLNKASRFEEELLAKFQKGNMSGEWQGYFEAKGVTYYGIAKPRVVNRECLLCHGSAEQAPAKLVEAYGPDCGFGHKEGELIGLELFAVSTQDIDRKIGNQAFPLFLFTSLMGILLAVVLFFFLRHWMRCPAMKEKEETGGLER